MALCHHRCQETLKLPLSYPQHSVCCGFFGMLGGIQIRGPVDPLLATTVNSHCFQPWLDHSWDYPCFKRKNWL